ncbi:MAG: O-antigen ligase family protein [Cyanothece sp. SIO1E1]|nr:O-antigen ligase family protein [Cyanothece sp. SIO1E1]
MRITPGTIEKSFAVLTLLLSTESFFAFLSQSKRQILWLGIYAITAGLLALQWQASLKVASRSKLLWIFVGLLVLSVFWSDTPTATLRPAVAFVGSTLFALYLAVRYSWKEQLHLLAWAFGIAALLSLMFAIALPSYGLQGGAAWRGIYHHYNTLGRIMLLSAVVFLLAAQPGQRYRWLAWIGFSLSTVLLLMSTSKTSLGIYLTLLLLLPLYKALRLYYKLAVLALMAGILTLSGMLLLVLSHLEAVLGAAGKDLTFTGRTDLWALVMEMIAQRPWLGYGFRGFWRGWNGASAYIWSVETWHPVHAHNGYLDLWLDLGLVGMVVFLLGFLLAFRRALIQVRLTKTPEHLLQLMYLTFMLQYNLTESVILLQNTLFWILYASIMLVRVEPSDRPVYDQEFIHHAPQLKHS